jgi:hypothetical protein
MPLDTKPPSHRWLTGRARIAVAVAASALLSSSDVANWSPTSLSRFQHVYRRIIETAQQQAPCRYTPGRNIEVRLDMHPTLSGFMIDQGGAIHSRVALSMPPPRTQLDSAHLRHGMHSMCAARMSEAAKTWRSALSSEIDADRLRENSPFIQEITRLLEHVRLPLDYGENSGSEGTPLLTVDTRPTSGYSAHRDGVQILLFAGFRIRCSIGHGRDRWWATLIPAPMLAQRLESIRIESPHHWSDREACRLLLAWTAVTVPACRDNRDEFANICDNARVVHGEFYDDFSTLN